MEVRLQKWGNSVGVRIPSSILKSLNLKTNDWVNLVVEDNKIVIAKIDKKHLSLEDRIAEYEGEIVIEDYDWGEARGERNMVGKYIPRQGDICYMEFFDKNSENKDLRPFLVISKDLYNKYTNMAIMCPISSCKRLSATHYELTSTSEVNGTVLCEHVRGIDYNSRELSYVESVNKEELEEIIDIINGFIEL